MGEPNYVAKRSAWLAVTPARVLFFWLIIPLIVMLVDIAIKKRDMLLFYDFVLPITSSVSAKPEMSETPLILYHCILAKR